MLVEYAQDELSRVGDIYDGMVNEAALDLVKLFASQGHSGGSAQLTMEIAGKLMQFKPLTPLTGEDSEWTEVADGTFQSKRCPSVFKDAEGKAWDIDLPREPDGDGGEGWKTITFPYTVGE